MEVKKINGYDLKDEVARNGVAAHETQINKNKNDINTLNVVVSNNKNEVDALKTSVSNDKVEMNAKINALTDGAPLVASSVNGMTDTTKIYVNTSDGNWYYHNGSAWVVGGVYQASVNSDVTNKSYEMLRTIYNNVLPLMNYLDNDNSDYGYYYLGSIGGTLGKGGYQYGYCAVKPFPVKAGVSYYVHNHTVGDTFSFICDENGVAIDTINRYSSNHHVFTPRVDGFAHITIPGIDDFNLPNEMITILGYEPANFVEFDKPYDFLILDNKFKEITDFMESQKESANYKINTIYVGSDKQFTTIKSAVNSISDANEFNRYNVVIDEGTYEESNINLPSYVNLIGATGNYKNIVIKGYNHPSVSDGVISGTSTINISGTNTLKNLTITAQNLRYPVHSESGNGVQNWEQLVDNCHIEHFGNQEVIDYRIANSLDYSGVWSSLWAWGEGASSGAYLKISNSTLKSVSCPFYMHGAESILDPYTHILENCKIIAKSTRDLAILVDNSSALIDTNTLIIKDCYVNGRVGIIPSSSKYNMIISGCGYIPVYQSGSNVLKEESYPIFTDYMEEYILSEDCTKGKFLYSVDGVNASKANSATNIKLVVGYAIGDHKAGEKVKVMKGYLQPLNQTWPETDTLTAGKFYAINDDSELAESLEMDKVVAVSSERFYKILI